MITKWAIDSSAKFLLACGVMKKLVLLALVSIASTPFASAELRIPSSVFPMDELAEAKQKAAEEEEPLIFVYTDPGTT